MMSFQIIEQEILATQIEETKKNLFLILKSAKRSYF